MSTYNRQLRLAHRPVGATKETDWNQVEEPLPTPGEGEFVVKILQLSIDPAMRGWMDAAPSYIPPVEIGAVMRAFAAGRVTESHHPHYATGDLVTGEFGVQEYTLSTGAGVYRIDPRVDIPLSAYLGVLGLTGITAYFGLLDVGGFQPGQTVVVSGAAGAVGSTVGQIVKAKGGRAIGIAGGEQKCRYLVERLGFDAAIDYKTESVRKSLRRHAPNGVNAFFDNVGGPILDDVLTRLARHARVVICGAVSQYNTESGPQGPKNYLSLLVSRARMEGFVVFDYAPRYPEAIADMSIWLADGKITNLVDIERGSIIDFPKTLARLFNGANTGKQILDIGSEDPDGV
jgi:NADPH-dependent curcumin reductase CurA